MQTNHEHHKNLKDIIKRVKKIRWENACMCSKKHIRCLKNNSIMEIKSGKTELAGIFTKDVEQETGKSCMECQDTRKKEKRVYEKQIFSIKYTCICYTWQI